MVTLAGGALDPRGPIARAMEDLWWLMWWLGLAVFVLVLVLLVAAVRRRDPALEPAPEETGTAGHGRWYVLGGVVLPAVGILVVFVATVAGMRDLPLSAPDDALVVEVTGHQWWWEIRYPEGPDGVVVTANELHVPAGRPVALEMTSADVIHSFWVPELAGKIDLLPDGTTTLVLEADEPGEFDGRCAEFCGLQHARMEVRVVAHSEEDFTAWLSTQAQPAAEPDTDLARRGREVFLAADCTRCHSIAGVSVGGDESTGEQGPDLTHLMSRARLGTAWPNTPEQLAAFVRDPHEVKEGIDMAAPDLDESELEALVAYLEGLR